MLTKYKEFLKLYEFNPGSEDPYTTISKKINKAIELGADLYVLKSTIKDILNYYNGQENTPKFNRRSEEYKYISIISDAIENSKDNGYPEDWIVGDLQKIYDQMK